MLDFRMETFLTVCKYMNFTHAAEELHITQPAVSQHIRYLEEHYETPLFYRKKKKLTLTSAGELLLSALETMQNDEYTLKNRMKESVTNKKILTFGVTMTIGEYAILPSLASFIKAHPDTDIHVRYGNTQTLLTCLQEGTIDFALVEGYFLQEKYETRIFKTDDYIAVASAKHSFQQPIHTLHDLTKERLIIREQGSGTRAILTRTLSLKNMTVRDFSNLVEVENIHTIVSLLREDCGISFLYRSAVEEEIQKGTLCQIPLLDFHMSHEFTFIWNQGSVFSKEYEEIYKELKEKKGLMLSHQSLRAIDGVRTRDPDLGKVVLYQLSHYRVFICVPQNNIYITIGYSKSQHFF